MQKKISTMSAANDQFERESNQSKLNQVIKKPSMPVVTDLEERPAPVKRRVESHKTEPIETRIVSEIKKGPQTPIQEIDDDKEIQEVEEEESVKKPSKKEVLSNKTLQDEDAEADISVTKVS